MKNNFLKKKNKLTKIIAIFVMLIIVLYACREELMHLEEEWHEANMIEHAKAWYESNKPETPQLLTSDGREQVPMKPDWTNVFETENENYAVVETDIMSKGRILYINEDCREKYEKTKDPKYNQCYTRIVFRTDKKTGKTVGFLMTVVPDLEWLEKSNFKPFMDVTYLFRSEQFGGMILFHEMDGRYANGWRYENGKVVAAISSLNVDPAEATLRSTVCQMVTYYQQYVECTYYYSGNESGITNIDVVCRTGWGYPFTRMECYEVGQNNQGSGSGTYQPGAGGGGTPNGGTPTNTTGVVQLVDCGAMPEATKNAQSTLTGIDKEGGRISALRSYTQADIEYGTSIDKTIVTNPNGTTTVTYSINPFIPGEDNGVKNMTAGKNVAYVIHTHNHNPGNRGPSAADIRQVLFYAYNQTYYSNFQGSIIITSDGTEYFLSVTNSSQAQAAYSDASLKVSNTNMFGDSKTAKAFNDIVDNLRAQGFSYNDAYDYAINKILSNKNTGLTLSKRDSSAGDFKQLTTDKTSTDPNYKPKICK